MKKLLAFGSIAISFLLLGCLNGLEHPNYPDEPEISFSEIKFIETPSAGVPDNLKLTINYKDGDMDLGLNPAAPEDSYFPYNDVFYYLATDPSATDERDRMDSISTVIVYETLPPYTPYFLLVSANPSFKGPLITNSTRSDPAYDFLPEYNSLSCENYFLTQLLVPESFDAVDETYNILDTLHDVNDAKYILIEEPVLYTKNENNHNISVDFFWLENDIWIEYDWYKNFCIDFNGRFPVLGNRAGKVVIGPFDILMKSPYEGRITYNMENASFKAIFGTKTLKLRISIKDRALHTSNVIETPPFTLSGL